MSDIRTEIYRYFQQREELFPGDFIAKPDKTIPNFQPDVKNTNKTNEHLILNSGNPLSKILFVCTRPLKADIEAAELLSGEPGALFDKILKAIDLSRKDVYITPLYHVSKEGKLSKTPDIDTFEKIVKERKPALIISLGENSGNTLMKERYKLTDVHGKIFKYGQINLIYTYHPFQILENSSLKRPVWEDFKIIKSLI